MDEIKTPGSSGEQKTTGSVVRPLAEAGERLGFGDRKMVLVFLAVGVVGVLSGFGVYLLRSEGTVRLGGRDVEVVKTPSEEGVKDASTFRDTATGLLKENDGKITDEGTHVLVRGDVSQNAYLTSSVVDLSKYVGKKVQVWGETFKGQTAGWLMDVGRIKVVDD